MQPQLVFATHNAHKLGEVQAIIGNAFALKSLNDIGCLEDIAETGTTFAANAGIKSRHVYEHYGLNCFADDSGLVVDTLNGEPGVYSARYSGSRNPEVNLNLVLEKMRDQPIRTARFVSVISLMWEGKEYQFEGRVEGSIALARSGTEGFGYDPIFIPEGYSLSFAQLDPAEKNRISHRGKAMEQLVTFLSRAT